MRGIAVLLVLWYHVWEISWLPAPFSWMQFIPETGFIGVHLFFFLSGFVIAYPFVRAQAAEQPRPGWRHFYYRRFIKIAPSYLLSIVLAYTLGYAAMVRYGATPVWQEVLTHLLFIHTWWPQTYGSINGVLWTLAVEVEFYALFPLIWYAFRRAPLATAAIMIGISIAWRAWTYHCCDINTFALLSENLPGYLGIFACGMLSAWSFVRFGHRLRAARVSLMMPGMMIAGIVALGTLLITLFNQRTLPQWEAFGQIYTRELYGLAFAAIAFGSLCAPARWQVLLANAPLRFLAIISYNLYLYHQLVARLLVSAHLPPYRGDPHVSPSWGLRYTIVAFVVTVAQAAIVTYAFERPLLQLREPRLIIARRGHSPNM